jgi:hypothetical protein
MSEDNPACANWKIWVGREVEGSDDLGVVTVFVRENPTPEGYNLDQRWNVLSDRIRHLRIRRFWFCKEFRDWEVIQRACCFPVKVCLEAVPGETIPDDVRPFLTVYWKVPNVPLVPGDFICVGPPFLDEAFKLSVGEGRRVNPDMYRNDQRIL